MRSALFLLLAAFSTFAQAGEWTRTSPTSIAFSGEIKPGELGRFLKVYRSTDKMVTLNSGGGRMDEGLAIGKILIENPVLTTVVKGVCASSCANYLFLAGKKRILDGGLLGFHGNWRAMMQSDKFQTELLRVPSRERADLVAFHRQKVREEEEF